ncbi:Protein kinase [Venturia inaequalis]|nr:Protein kinase [Venturia inaequalis]
MGRYHENIARSEEEKKRIREKAATSVAALAAQ